MISSTLLALTAALPLVASQSTTSPETVLAAYIFHRHGDRTPKILAPTNLTDLGYRQVFDSGSYYRNRYVSASSPGRIAGINADQVLQSQIQAAAPADDVVLEQSAVAFLQALYPPVGVEAETLANGSRVTAPMDGYQIIPVEQVENGNEGAEGAAWLQGTSECGKAVLSSNEYFSTPEFNAEVEGTRAFYEMLTPIIESVFAEKERNFDNAYTIFDYINVAEIHNTTIPAAKLLDSDVLLRLRNLASIHEWNLAFNSSAPIRAIAGSQLAGEVTEFLSAALDSEGQHVGPKMGVQFGSYGTFMSFFGLAGLTAGDWQGITHYASSMVFELFTKGGDEKFVRFLYHNGTASEGSPPAAYPLFGSGNNELSWDDFQRGMGAFAIGDAQSWCTSCGNFTGTCAAYAPAGSSSSSAETGSEGGCRGGLSPVVNGVIGAMVTLAVVLGLEAAILLLGGFRVVRKKASHGATEVVETKA